jgi:hypothetical protein
MLLRVLQTEQLTFGKKLILGCTNIYLGKNDERCRAIQQVKGSEGERNEVGGFFLRKAFSHI